MDILNIKIKDMIYNIATKWGKIKGNITEQTDLKNALDNKANINDIPDITGKLDKSNVKNEYSTTADNVYDVRYINTMLGDIEAILTTITTGGGVS